MDPKLQFSQGHQSLLIVHLITGLRRGGAENQLLQLVLHSDKRRFRHAVISIEGEGPIAAELRAAGVEVQSLRVRRSLPSPIALLRLVQLLRTLRPAILHCWLYHGCLTGVLGARLAGVRRLVWGLRSANPGLRDYSFLTRRIVRLCARLSFLPDAIIAISEKCRTVHRDFGFETSRMRVIANGVDVQRFYPDTSARKAILESLNLPFDSILVGLFARYSPMKDHETFLRAAGSVSQRYPRVRFLLAGIGIDNSNERLLDMIRAGNLQDVVSLLGERHDMPRLTAALDVACLSSWSESFGNVVVEAMACAVPCVVTDVGDLASVVGDTGRVVPPSNPSALAEAILAVLTLPAKERAMMGQRAKERVLDHFTIQRTVRAYEQLYEECASGNYEGQAASMATSYTQATSPEER